MEQCPEAVDSLSFVLRGGIRVTDLSHYGPVVQAWLKAQEAIAEQNFMEAVAILDPFSANNLK